MIFFYATGLFGVVDVPCLSNDTDLDLAGIFRFFFDSLGNFSCHQNHIVIGYGFGLDSYADFAACLDSEGFGNAGMFICNLFQGFKSLDIGFDVLASGTGTGGRDGIGSLYQHSDESLCRHIAVVGLDGVENFFAFIVLLGKFKA